MYHQNTKNVATINHITFQSGHVFGTAGITVLVAFSEVLAHAIVNLISSHQSSGIIQTCCSQSHCFVYTNTWSLIFAVPKCIQSFVFGLYKLISTFQPFELSVQNILTSSHSTV